MKFHGVASGSLWELWPTAAELRPKPEGSLMRRLVVPKIPILAHAARSLILAQREQIKTGDELQIFRIVKATLPIDGEPKLEKRRRVHVWRNKTGRTTEIAKTRANLFRVEGPFLSLYQTFVEFN
jgi:hypothetical protein